MRATIQTLPRYTAHPDGGSYAVYDNVRRKVVKTFGGPGAKQDAIADAGRRTASNEARNARGRGRR